ncbi:MAG: repressor LexA, partial [Proteobacteria bacterium]|nr:repressor LexA [Pseudomonadota bacterium]
MVIESRNKNGLTQHQAAVLEFIQTYCRETGVSPSYREIQKHFNYKSVGTVQDHVRALIKKGMLEKTYGQNSTKARALLPRNQKRTMGKTLSVYGEIAAGGPREGVELELGTIVVAEEFAEGECFALRVVGNSMIEAGIFEGDYVIVKKSTKIKSGDIVVALIEGETTVKKYQEKNGKIYLVPENSSMKPIEVK